MAEGAERSTTGKGRDGGSPGSNEPQSWPFSGRFYPLRWPPPSKRGQGRARSRCLFAVLSQEWLFHAPHRLCFQRHPGNVRMLHLPGRRRPMRQFVRWLCRLEAGIRSRGASQGHQSLDHPGPDGDELRAGDHQCRPRPAQFQSLARCVSRQARGHDHRIPGPLLAIWGMETGFGSQRGNQNMLASIATLAYDCRRSEYFTEHLYAALQLIDRGALSPSQRGSMHGEVGQTQFMPKAILAYGTGNLENSANALNSTANFLRAHGWRAGAGYQPGEPNFAAIQAWNAAGVYQKAIALMGRQIDGGSE